MILCRNGKITGIHVDGGYAEYMLASFHALARVPEGMGAAEGGPLLCAGVTTFNSIRNAGALAGDTVAVLGIGGLGHLGIQYAARMGFRTIAIARGADKEPLAKQLGAHHYINSQKSSVAEALQKLGGANLIIATVTSGQAMADAVPGLAPDGKLIVVGAPADPLNVSAFSLIGNRTAVQGWPSGVSIDSEDTLNFSALHGVKSMNETFPLERAAEAYDRMISGKARFRVVLTAGQ
jgi:D-arabinose 1-dehydrogenase-like Zn-dependent alcohol dehydrogenase